MLEIRQAQTKEAQGFVLIAEHIRRQVRVSLYKGLIDHGVRDTGDDFLKSSVDVQMESLEHLARAYSLTAQELHALLEM